MDDLSFPVRIMQVLSCEPRVQILKLLGRRALCVNALASRLGITQGAVSQHLRIMRDNGLLTTEKRGNFVHYSINVAVAACWRAEIHSLTDDLLGSEAVIADVGPESAASRAISPVSKPEKQVSSQEGNSQ